MQKNFRLFLLLTFVSFLHGCGIFKKNIRPETPQKDNNMTQLFDQMRRHRLTPDYLQAKWKVDYADAKQSYAFTVNLNMVRDTAILMTVTKFSFPIAKILVTPGQVAYYENLGRTAYEGDPEELSRKTGIPFDFDILQSLLLGNVPLTLLDDDGWEVEMAEGDPVLARLYYTGNRWPLVYLDINTLYRLYSSVWQYDNQQLEILYPAYKDGLPEQIEMTAGDKRLHIEWKKTKFPDHLRWHFEIPSSYKRISGL